MTAFEYDANGNLVRTVRADGRATTTTYDPLGRPLVDTDAAGSTTSNEHDPGGKPVAVTDTEDGGTTTYVYDANDRLLSETAPGASLTYGYDADGLRVARDANGSATAYLWDTNRELAQVLEEHDGGATPAARTVQDCRSCETCTDVVDRIQTEDGRLLPDLCRSGSHARSDEASEKCHQVLAALVASGSDLRYWLFEGCYDYRASGGKAWRRPCPSAEICRILRAPDGAPFCDAGEADPF